MKDLKYETDLKQIDQLLSLCSEHEIEVEQYQLALNDGYIIYNNGLLSMAGRGRKPKGRKYILVISEYANEWSNRLYILCTDNEQTVEEYQKVWCA